MRGTDEQTGSLFDAELTQATGWAERAAAEAMIETTAPSGGVTLGADKGYDTKAHVANPRALGATPHVAQNRKNRRWMKAAGGFRQTKHRGRDRVGWMFTMRAAA